MKHRLAILSAPSDFKRVDDELGVTTRARIQTYLATHRGEEILAEDRYDDRRVAVWKFCYVFGTFTRCAIHSPEVLDGSGSPPLARAHRGPSAIVVLEGPRCSGKTSLARAAAQMLCERGVTATTFLHDATPPSGDAYCAALNQALQRASMCFATDYPENTVVLIDGWHSSLSIDQSFRYDARVERVLEMERSTLPVPPVGVILDAPDAVLDARLAKLGERADQSEQLRRERFRAIQDRDVARLDTTGDPEITADCIVSLVLQALGEGSDS